MSARSKKPTYADYEAGLRALEQASRLPKMICLYGPSEYLREAARERVTTLFRKAGVPTVAMESGSMHAKAFRELWEQASLFDPVQAYVLKRADQNKALTKMLDEIPTANAMACHMILVAGMDKLLVAMSKSLDRLQTVTVPCYEPWPSDMPQLAQKMAAAKGVHLAGDAVTALMEAVGTDLAKLDNELDKLALLGLGEKKLTGADVRPFLGLIREDHVFKLDQYLTEGDWGHAHALCSDLLARGEKGLQLLWIFSNHCRKALQAHELRRSGVSARDIGFKLRLPPALAKSYTSLINRTAPERFREVLVQCQKADMALKASRTSESLILSQLVESLAGRAS